MDLLWDIDAVNIAYIIQYCSPSLTGNSLHEMEWTYLIHVCKNKYQMPYLVTI